MATRTVSIPTLFPAGNLPQEQCAKCVREQLLKTPGVRKADLHHANGDEHAMLELDYDPRLIPLERLDAELRSAGACCQVQRASVVLGVDGMVSPRYEEVIESALARLPGVVASASFASRSLR